MPRIREELRRFTATTLTTVDRRLGELPGASGLPSGCSFHPCCPVAMPACAFEIPPLYEVGSSHRSACLWHDRRFSSGVPDGVRP